MNKVSGKVKLILLVLVLIVLVAIAAVSLPRIAGRNEQAGAKVAGIRAHFTCDQGKSSDGGGVEGAATPPTAPDRPPTPGGSVQLSLSDGRSLTLPQTLSADGARFANSGESIIFWNKGNGSFIEEAGTTTFSGCVTNN